MSDPVGWERHGEGVDRMVRSFHAIPRGAPVRLRTTTSNLFRPRVQAEARLDASGLTGVVALDRDARTADVQGMCTYEDLVDVTLAHGLMPLVVPQLRTITLGGAVSGLGIEATSFRSGLPHESVREMDVLTGAGEVVTTRPGEELFDTFPNTYGSLGYATRLRIDLEPAPAVVGLRHVRFDDAALLAKTVAEIEEQGSFDGERVDALDGVALRPRTPGADAGDLARHRRADQRLRRAAGLLPLGRRAATPTCSAGATTSGDGTPTGSGAPAPSVPSTPSSGGCGRVGGAAPTSTCGCSPSTVGSPIADRLDRRAGRPQRERVVQDVEVPLDRLPEFLAWFDERVGMRPVWLCPVRATRTWPTYPLDPEVLYVNVGFWGTVHVGPDAADAPLNRAIEQVVHELGGHKSLYSEAFYDRATFDALYDGDHLARVKAQFDPDNRLTGLYDKVVRRA